MDIAEIIKQNGSEEVNNNKNVRVSVVKGRKITTTTASAILVVRKLSMASTKVTLLGDE